MVPVSEDPQRYKRTQMEISVDCLDEDGKSYKGSVGNLSISGALIECSSSPEVGKAVKTNLTLQKESIQLQITGKVVREDERGFAIQFNTIQSDDYRMLARLVTIANKE